MLTRRKHDDAQGWRSFGFSANRVHARIFSVNILAVASKIVLATLFALLATFQIACNSEAEIGTLAGDEAAIRELRRLGADVAPVSDARIDTGTYLVTLYSEHITDEGLIADDVYVQLIRLRKLILGLNNTHLDDVGFSKIQRMENLFGLNLHNTQITDYGLKELEGFPTLRLLKLDNTNVTSDGIQRLGEMPNLSMLYLSGTQITDAALKSISDLPKLEALKLSRTKVTDEGLTHLKQAWNLAYLGLDGTDVTVAGVRQLVGLPELTYLNLRNTSIPREKRWYFKYVFPECEVIL